MIRPFSLVGTLPGVAARGTGLFVLLAAILFVSAHRDARGGVVGTISTQAGEVRALAAANATTMFAGTQGGGLWKTIDTGATWSRVASFPARYVWSVAVPASSPATIYAGTSTGLFRSTDGGTSWTQCTFDAVRAVAADAGGSTLFIGVPGAGILRSTDGGATFVDISAGLDSADVRAIVIDNAGNAFAALFSNSGGNWGGVFRLANGAAAWQSWNDAGAGGASALGSRYVTGLAVNATTLLAATADGTGSGAGKVYRNTLAGPGWSNPGDPSSGAIFDAESVAVDRGDASGHAFLAGSRAFGVWRSINDGLTWTQKASGPPAAEVRQMTIAIGTFPGSARAVVAQSGAGLFYTMNIASDPASWQSVGGFTADRVLSVANHAVSAPATYYIGLSGGGVKKSINAGVAWSPLLVGFSAGGPDPVLGSASAVAAHPTDTGIVYAALRTTGLYALSGGATWTGAPGAPGVLMPQDLEFDAAGANLYYTLFNPGGGVWRRTGGAWSLIEPGAWPGNIGAARLFQSSSGALLAMMFDALPRRSPSGAAGTWTTVGVASAANDTGFMRLAFAAITEKPGSGGATLLAAANRGLYRSGDNGQNWYRVTVAAPATMHTALSAVQYGAGPSPVWAADRSGALYCSTNDGDSWVAAGQAGAPVVELVWLNGQLLALTDGNGIAKIGASCP